MSPRARDDRSDRTLGTPPAESLVDQRPFSGSRHTAAAAPTRGTAFPPVASSRDCAQVHRPSGHDPCLPLRSGRRPDADGHRPLRRVEADVRRVPASPRAGPGGVQPARLQPLRRRQAPGRRGARLPGEPRHHTARGQPGRPAGRGHRLGHRDPQERHGAARARRARGGGLSRLGRLPPCREGGGAGHRGGDGVGERREGHRGRRVRRPHRRARRRSGGRPRRAARQAGARHLPRRSQGPRGRPRTGGRLRGRDLRGPGRAGRQVRLRRRRGPRRTGRRAEVGRRGRRRPGPLGAAGKCAVTEGRATFPVEPWSLTEVGLDHASLAVHESVFALTNGHIGMRGSFEEGEPVVVPGTYLNGFFEERPLPYAEAGYGFPEQGQTMVNVTDGKLIRLLVKDSPLDLDYGQILDHHRTLDLRAGVLRRSTEWRSPGGRTVRVTSTRLVSLTRRSIAAIEYKVEVTDDLGDLYVALQSDLLANESGAGSGEGDPRAAAMLGKPLQLELAVAKGKRAVLVHRTTRSQLRLAAGMDHIVETPDSCTEEIEATGDLARYTLAAR